MAEATFTLLRASAGTGKTYQLVEHYAALVATGGLAPDQIVAITFTRAAAQELRRRIGQRLRALAVPAERLWSLAHAPIGTFHQLCARWLAEHAGRDEPVPTVLEEEGADLALFVAAAERTWFAAEGSLAEAVHRVASSCRAGLSRAVIAELFVAISLARSHGHTLSEAWLGPPYTDGGQGAEVQAACAALRERLCALTSAQGGLTARGREVAKAALAVPTPEAFAPSLAWAEAWLAFLAALNLTSLKALLDKAARSALVAELTGIAGDLACASLQSSWQALAASAWQAYTADKQRQQLVDYSDLIERVVQALRLNCPLRTALGQTVAAVLVDEAQDIDPMQRELIWQLVKPAVGGVANLCVVGDVKQCIYGFRGVDTSTFEALANDVATAGGHEQVLRTSYRAQAPLQEGINALGRHLFGDTYSEVLPAGRPMTGALTPGLFVREATCEQSSNAPASVRAEAEGGRGAKRPGAAARLREEVERSADLVALAHQRGMAFNHIAILCRSLRSVAHAFATTFAERQLPLIVHSRGQLFLRADVRQWWSLLAWLADGSDLLPMAVALRSPLFACPDDVLAALLMPAGRARCAAAALRSGDARPLLDLLPPELRQAWRERLTAWAKHFAAGARALGHLSPVAALDALNALFLQAAFCQARAGAEQTLLHLQQLAQLAWREEAQGQWHAGAFVLKHYRRMVADARQDDGSPLSPAAAAVTLASVHYSKGLEWPYVILPLLNRPTRREGAQVAYDPHTGLVFAPHSLRGALTSQRWQRSRTEGSKLLDLEQRRLLYVAATRAKERLDLVAPAATKGAKYGFYALLAPWLASEPAGVAHQPVEAPLPASASAPPKLAHEAAELQAAWRRLQEPRQLPAGTSLDVAVSEVVMDYPQPAASPLLPTPSVAAVAATTSSDVAASAKDRTEPAGTRHSPAAAADVARLSAARLLTFEQAQLTQTDLGIVAHEALAATLLAPRDKSPVDTLRRCLQAAMSRRGGEAAATQRAELEGALSRFLLGPLGAALLASAPSMLRSEWPVQYVHQSGGHTVRLRGQVDLLALRGGSLWLIDFKFARRHGDVAAHLRQLDAYALALSGPQGPRTDVAASVVYLREPQDMAVAHVATTARQRQIVERLEAWLGGLPAATWAKCSNLAERQPTMDYG